MTGFSRRLAHLEREAGNSVRIRRAISNLVDMGVPASWETLPYLRPLDPSLDFMITFPARSKLHGELRISGAGNGKARQLLLGVGGRVRRARTYFHIPFCRSICRYCMFFVRYLSRDPDQQDTRVRRYLEALKLEWELLKSHQVFRDMVSRSIYVGGGTPTALNVEQLRCLIEIIRTSVTAEQGADFTFEAHPGTISEEKLGVLREGGVNRISMGVESLDNHVLEIAGRKGYRKDELPVILGMIADAGIENVNVDMMYGLPGETLSGFDESLQHLVDLFDADLLTTVTWYPLSMTRRDPKWTRGHRLPGSIQTIVMARMIRELFVDDLDSRECPVRFFEPNLYSDSRRKEKVVDWNQIGRDRFLKYEDSEIGTGNFSYSYLHDHSFVNERGISRYLERIEAKEFPTATAFPMSNELKFERAVLKGCQVGWIDLDAVEEVSNIDLLDRKNEMISEMFGHDLISIIDGRQIHISEKGKLDLEAVARALAFTPSRYEALTGTSAGGRTSF